MAWGSAASEEEVEVVAGKHSSKRYIPILTWIRLLIDPLFLKNLTKDSPSYKPGLGCFWLRI